MVTWTVTQLTGNRLDQIYIRMVFQRQHELLFAHLTQCTIYFTTQPSVHGFDLTASHLAKWKYKLLRSEKYIKRKQKIKNDYHCWLAASALLNAIA